MMYVRIFPVMNLVLFYFDILSLGILLVEYLCYHGFHVLTNLHEVLIEDALTLIMREDMDPAPELPAVPIERLKNVPMCLLRSDDLWSYNDFLVQECQRSGFTPNVTCHCYDTPMAMQLVRSGFGISFLPHSIVETHPNSGIYAKPLRGIPAKSYPVLVWSDDVQGAPCVQRRT